MLLALLVALNLGASFAELPQGACRAPPGAPCNECEPKVHQKFKEVIAKFESPQNPFKSVDSFLKALPIEMKRDFVLITGSGSPQCADPLHPRVIMRSPDSEVTCTFGTKPDCEGYASVECSEWNAREGKNEFHDFNFPGDLPTKFKSVNRGTPERPTHSKNPNDCITCHGTNNRYIFDSYPRWPNSIPLQDGFIRNGSPDSVLYQSFIEKIEKAEGRIGVLVAPIASSDLKKVLEESPYYRLSHGPIPSVPNPLDDYYPQAAMIHQFNHKNACSISTEIQKSKYGNKIKYAFTAAVFECDGLRNMFPRDAERDIYGFFRKRLKPKKDDGVIFDDIVGDTRRRLNAEEDQGYIRGVEHLKNHMRVIREKYPSRAGAMPPDIKKSGEYLDVYNSHISTKNNIGDIFSNNVSRFRYVLEPFGFDVSKWSMNESPGSYTLVPDLRSQFVSNDLVDGVCKEIGIDCKAFLMKHTTEDQRQLCKKLASKSLIAFGGGPSPEFIEETKPPPCKTSDASIDALKPVTQAITADVLRPKAHDILNKKCTGCHDGSALNAPFLPLEKMEDLEAAVGSGTKTKTGRLLTSEIQDRVTRHLHGNGVAGKMPPFENLENVEAETLINYLKALPTSKQVE